MMAVEEKNEQDRLTPLLSPPPQHTHIHTRPLLTLYKTNNIILKV